ncbi:MAG: hypothetical protein ACU0A6_10285 [Shimia sp.]|uniref:hypothetical protein n=1 Tax=Shimia sp. TaxID=1954381 RepID=UPI004058BB24
MAALWKSTYDTKKPSKRKLLNGHVFVEKGKMAVLSDGFELVSAGTVMLPFNPHKVGATQREQQHGLT